MRLETDKFLYLRNGTFGRCNSYANFNDEFTPYPGKLWPFWKSAGYTKHLGYWIPIKDIIKHVIEERKNVSIRNH